MDYLIIFFAGYASRDLVYYFKNLLDKFSFEKEFKTIQDLDAEWNWNSDDLP